MNPFDKVRLDDMEPHEAESIGRQLAGLSGLTYDKVIEIGADLGPKATVGDWRRTALAEGTNATQ